MPGMIRLYNTLTRSVEPFAPLKKGEARIYTCGPTVYNYAHIGNLRSYVFADTLKRSLAYFGYAIGHGMNITDVGHLTSDGDDGDDKMEMGAKRENKHPLEIARFYEERFLEDMGALNILPPSAILRATETVPQQIEIIRLLEDKGYTYRDEQAMYFDTSKLPDYGALAGQALEEKKTGARSDVVVDERKRNPQDFALWFFRTGRYEHHILYWPSPWGDGFPGWHIECSAISRALLGQPFDIHTGGVDHIGTHHANEMAQSEAAFGVPLAQRWMHGEFLLAGDGKMAKSAGTFIRLADVVERGYHPLVYRYLCLTAHYRSRLNFTWESLEAAQTALGKLYAAMTQLKPQTSTHAAHGGSGTDDPSLDVHENAFTKALEDDLNMPQAVAAVWNLLRDSAVTADRKYELLMRFDTVLGLGLDNPPLLKGALREDELPDDVRRLMRRRAEARLAKDYPLSDLLRDRIASQGYTVKDTAAGMEIRKT